MTNSNNQLIKFSQQELTSSYQQILQELYHQLKANKERLAYQKIPLRTGFDSFLFSFSSECSRLEDQERAKLMQLTESEFLDLAQSAFSQQTKQLISWASDTIKNVIDNSQTQLEKSKQELIVTQTLMNEQDNQIQALEQEKIDISQELTEVKQNLATIEKELKETQQKLNIEINWVELQQNKRKSITSPEHYLKEQLVILQEKYSNLSEENLSTEQLLANKTAELDDYFCLVNQLSEKEVLLTRQIAELTKQRTDYSRKILALEAVRILSELQVRNEITERRSAERKLISLQKQKRAWEQEKAKAKENLQHWQELEDSKLERFNATALDNAKLKAQNIELNDIIAQGTKLVDNLTETLNKQANELTDLKAQIDKLKKLQRINLLGKTIKWTSRATLPTAWATSIEIGIDAYETKQAVYPGSYELTWMIFGLVAFFSLKKIISYFFPAKQSKLTSQPTKIHEKNQ